MGKDAIHTSGETSHETDDFISSLRIGPRGVDVYYVTLAATGLAYRDLILHELVSSGVTGLDPDELSELTPDKFQDLLREVLSQVPIAHIAVDGVEELDILFQGSEAQVNEEDLNR